MTEIRPLTRKELDTIIDEAQDSETRNLKRLVKEPYDFFQRKAINQEGIVIDQRPIYFGAVTFNQEKERFEIWTIVNRNVRQQFSLYKIAKRISHQWAKTYKEIYATMEKMNEKNLTWTKRIGFVPIYETDRLITLRLGGI
jgi:hypothetical protein